MRCFDHRAPSRFTVQTELAFDSRGPLFHVSQSPMLTRLAGRLCPQETTPVVGDRQDDQLRL